MATTDNQPKPKPAPQAKHFMKDLRVGYDRAKLLGKLDDFIPNSFVHTSVHTEAENYVNAIGNAFYYNAVAEESRDPDRGRLTEPDRERCLLALLASRGRTFELAAHVYIALMMKISEAEIRHILFLAGVYAGSDSLNASLMVLNRTLEVLDDVAPKHLPCEVVLGVLAAEFAGSPTKANAMLMAEIADLKRQLEAQNATVARR
jgi:alkylhydroperoxidase/carboxymuconolactone decarboxylase family protein YurZ